MNFHMDLIKDCFKTWVHVKILETLIGNPEAMSQRQLAKIMGINRATTRRALHDLGETGLIRPHQIGRSTYWEIDRESYLYETLSPVLEGLHRVVPPLLYLKKLIQETLHMPRGYRLFLFGSTAEGRDLRSSDIDICVILPGRLKEPAPDFRMDLEALMDRCRQKFGKTLATLFINEGSLKKEPDKELHRNVLKGWEIS